MAFSVSDFKTKGIRKGGARSALFAVELHYPTTISNSSLQSNFLIKGASIPASTVGSYDVFFQGKAIKVAGDRTFDTWETTIINDEDFALRKVLEKWIDLISDPKLNTRDTKFASVNKKEGENAGYKKDIKVIQYNKNGTEGPHYHFRNAFPTALSAIALDWASADIQEYTCTWTYDSWDQERSHDTNTSTTTTGPEIFP
tara:strand:+ start:2104 stop:2703 length:600 start_codon:yes stop_codon:yes gene_type:complete